jgi:hypothetical protein
MACKVDRILMGGKRGDVKVLLGEIIAQGDRK